MILKHLVEGDYQAIRACSYDSNNIVEIAYEKHTFEKPERGHQSAPFDETYQPNLYPDETPTPNTHSRTEHKTVLVLRWLGSATENPHHSTRLWFKNRVEEMLQMDTVFLR